MSKYSKAEQNAYNLGVKIGKSIRQIGFEFNKISKAKWLEVYQNQIDELIKENENLRFKLKKRARETLSNPVTIAGYQDEEAPK